MKKRRRKLTKKEKKFAGKYVAEEFRTKKYKPKQAIAIGISRAKKKVADLKAIARRHGLKHGG